MPDVDVGVDWSAFFARVNRSAGTRMGAGPLVLCAVTEDKAKSAKSASAAVAQSLVFGLAGDVSRAYGNASRMADIRALAKLAWLYRNPSRPAGRKPIAAIFIVGALTAPDRRSAPFAALWPFVTRLVAVLSGGEQAVSQVLAPVAWPRAVGPQKKSQSPPPNSFASRRSRRAPAASDRCVHPLSGRKLRALIAAGRARGRLNRPRNLVAIPAGLHQQCANKHLGFTTSGLALQELPGFLGALYHLNRARPRRASGCLFHRPTHSQTGCCQAHALGGLCHRLGPPPSGGP